MKDLTSEQWHGELLPIDAAIHGAADREIGAKQWPGLWLIFYFFWEHNILAELHVYVGQIRLKDLVVLWAPRAFCGTHFVVAPLPGGHVNKLTMHEWQINSMMNLGKVFTQDMNDCCSSNRRCPTVTDLREWFVQNSIKKDDNLCKSSLTLTARPCHKHRWFLAYPVLYILTRSSADADKSARRVQRSVKVTKHGNIRYVRHCFLLVCYSKFVRKTHRFWDIRLTSIQWPWNPC